MAIICEGLPPRQAQVITLAAKGYSEKMSAREMSCSVANVQSLRSTIYYKLGARNITEAVAIAFQRGVLKTLALVLAIGTVSALLPAPAKAETDDSMIRRVRTKPSGRATRRIANDHIPDAGEMVNQDFIHFHRLQPVLVWDDGLYLTFQ